MCISGIVYMGNFPIGLIGCCRWRPQTLSYTQTDTDTKTAIKFAPSPFTTLLLHRVLIHTATYHTL